MSDAVADLQARMIRDAFRAMAHQCRHRDGADCAEPRMEFSHMTCSPANCPLLLDDDDDA